MTGKHEVAARRFCAAWGDGTRQRPDKELILSLMHPDAEWTLWVPGGGVQRGHDAISAEIDRQAPMMEFLDCRIGAIASAGQTVFTERTDHFVFMGKPVAFDLVAIFELDTDGLIRAWREYFDTASVAATMGIEQAQI
jgi:limonene-1,2-epoxide hydrolase